MPWMKVTALIGESERPIENVINMDAITRFGPRLDGGAFIKFIGGDSVQVADPFEEIVQVVLQADAKKAQ